VDAPSVTVGGVTVPTVPYRMTPALVAPGGQNAETLAPDAPYFYKEPARSVPANRADWGLMAGWPDASRANPEVRLDLNDPATNQREIWSKHAVDVVTGRGGRQPTMDYHPYVVDQRQFGLNNGALMKLVVGVRFQPYTYSHLRKGSGVREFWLASLKADLEE
jgi:hypothetical protein